MSVNFLSFISVRPLVMQILFYGLVKSQIVIYFAKSTSELSNANMTIVLVRLVCNSL